jgi:hypothetical protein
VSILNILKYAPQYHTELFKIFFERKDFVSAKNATPDLREAFTFLLYSIVLVVIVIAGLTGSIGTASDLGKILSLMATTCLLSVFLITGIVHVIWGMLGAENPARRFFCTFAYFAGASAVVSPFAGLLIVGTFRWATATSPGLYRDVWRAMSGYQQISLYDLGLAALPFSVVLAVLAGFSVWLAPAREEFRRLNGLSRWRSFVAQVLFSLALPLAFAVVFIVYNRLLQITGIS